MSFHFISTIDFFSENGIIMTAKFLKIKEGRQNEND